MNSRIVAENAGRVALECDPDRKLFLFTHFYDPHFDYIPPSPWCERFDPDYEGTIHGSGYWKNPLIHDAKREPARQVSDRDLDHIRALYRGEIGWTDEAIGLLLAELEESGRLAASSEGPSAPEGYVLFESLGNT